MTLPDGIVDPHHHLWVLPHSTYVTSDLQADLATVPQVTSTVFVECGAWYRTEGPAHLREVGETDWVAAQPELRIKAIVGATDLRLGDRTVEALDAHIAAAADRFRGIRHRATWDADIPVRNQPDPGPNLLLDSDFRRGFAELTTRNLSFDAWLYFTQLPDLVDLARSFPQATIVLNHLGGPLTTGPYRDRAAVLARWRPLLAEVATCPNIVLKVGGIGMTMYGMTWHKDPTPVTPVSVADWWWDEVHFAIDTFGPDRCMLESNFPVDRVSMSYATLWQAFDLLTADYSGTERASLFHGTATQTYRL